MKFIEEVNNTFTELDLENKYHKYDKRKFKLFSYKVIHDSLIENRTEENRNFIFNVIIFREDKDKHFSFQKLRYPNCSRYFYGIQLLILELQNLKYPNLHHYLCH